MKTNFNFNSSFSVMVVGMFEKYGSTENDAVNFCNKLIACKSSHTNPCKIIRQYNEKVHSNALISAIAYLSVFEEINLYKLLDDDYVFGWMAVFSWYKRNGSSFRCFIDGVESSSMNKFIGLLLECGELTLEQNKEFGCLNICLNPNNKSVDTSRAFEIYNSCMHKPDFLGFAYNNVISMEEASCVIGSEIVEGNLELIGYCKGILLGTSMW